MQSEKGAAGMQTLELCNIYEVTDYFSLYFRMPVPVKTIAFWH